MNFDDLRDQQLHSNLNEKRTYLIVWYFCEDRIGKEVLDETDCIEDAKYLANEYKLAFNSGSIEIEEGE